MEISFMNEILVAKNELAAYLVNSAERTSIKIIGFPLLTYGAYNSFNIFFAFSESVPITILSGFIKSSTANPSRKNSGFETTSNSTLVFAAMVDCTISAVPTGTVLLSIMIL